MNREGSQAADYSVTFVTPHQRPRTGGAYAIQQFASNLVPFMGVNLVVQHADPDPVEGVSTYRSQTLSPDELPDADAIVHWINAADGDSFLALPASKGERLFLFQGYKVLGSELVRDRLRQGLRVLAVSRWLVEDARRHGARPLYTPDGLDHSVFFPGPPSQERGATVAMMLHPTYWKGLPDGVAALALVKEERPDTEIRLFAVAPPAEPPPFEHTLLTLGEQTDVAELLRRTAIFVCSSWEEGFGMLGLEALACGTALATTDTKGNRDYAVDGETALVSPPRDPRALARSVLTLLEDEEKRERLCERGTKRAQEHPGWDDAAAMMARALLAGAE